MKQIWPFWRTDPETDRSNESQTDRRTDPHLSSPKTVTVHAPVVTRGRVINTRPILPFSFVNRINLDVLKNQKRGFTFSANLYMRQVIRSCCNFVTEQSVTQTVDRGGREFGYFVHSHACYAIDVAVVACAASFVASLATRRCRLQPMCYSDRLLQRGDSGPVIKVRSGLIWRRVDQSAVA